ncbi:HIT domain-containing protein [Candidatus Woesearchaeota archaeon]|nr:HIT domain-containing protein [Candidatus Woesearchaeota archaeon]
MTEDCILCSIIEGKIPSKKVYEDDDSLAILDVNGSNPGHCFVIPKQHYPILEQVPDFQIAKLFGIANKISTVIFEALKAEGTNVFVTNGVTAGQTVAHFMINVIPRSSNDKINLQWQPKQLDEEEMSTIELKLKEEAKNMGVFQTKKTFETRTIKKEPERISGEENYLIKQLRKIP